MNVSIIICTLNRCNYLERTLISLLDLSVPSGTDYEIIVVDNGSTDKTLNVIKDYSSKLPLICIHEPRQGLSFARNRGIESASGDLILWTDDDVVVDPYWMSEYINAAMQWPSAVFFGGPIEPLFDGRPPNWIIRNLEYLTGVYSLLNIFGQNRPMQEGEFPIGANMLIRVEAQKRFTFNCSLGRSGGSLISGEDSEIFWRLIAEGYSGVWVPSACVMHHIGMDRANLKYIKKWYFSNGRTAARIGGLGRSPQEAVTHLAMSRSGGLIRSNEPASRWWYTFFNGPLWLRLIKVAFYFQGFHREIFQNARR